VVTDEDPLWPAAEVVAGELVDELVVAAVPVLVAALVRAVVWELELDPLPPHPAIPSTTRTAVRATAGLLRAWCHTSGLVIMVRKSFSFGRSADRRRAAQLIAGDQLG
jgi:hypothetical protein